MTDRSAVREAESKDGALRNPFATPHDTMVDMPAQPKPVLHKKHRADSDDTVMSNATTMVNEPAIVVNEKSGSMSSMERSNKSPVRSVDAGAKRSSRGSERNKLPRGSRDLEKGGAGTRRSRDRHHYSGGSRRTYTEEDEAAEAKRIQEAKALKILLFLAMPCVALSFLNAIWTFISLIITLFSQPVRLCARRPSFGQQLGGLLGPSLNLQLKCIYTPLPPHANEDTTYHPWMLVMVQLLSPFLSLGVMIAAWVTAAFWISSLVVGDPSGLDRRDDGNDTVLALRTFWEKWLYRSIRDE